MLGFETNHSESLKSLPPRDTSAPHGTLVSINSKVYPAPTTRPLATMAGPFPIPGHPHGFHTATHGMPGFYIPTPGHLMIAPHAPTKFYPQIHINNTQDKTLKRKVEEDNDKVSSDGETSNSERSASPDGQSQIPSPKGPITEQSDHHHHQQSSEDGNAKKKHKKVNYFLFIIVLQ